MTGSTRRTLALFSANLLARPSECAGFALSERLPQLWVEGHQRSVPLERRRWPLPPAHLLLLGLPRWLYVLFTEACLKTWRKSSPAGLSLAPESLALTRESPFTTWGQRGPHESPRRGPEQPSAPAPGLQLRGKSRLELCVWGAPLCF